MSTSQVLFPNPAQSAGGAGVYTGCWRLPAGQAMSLTAPTSAMLYIDGGSAWATLDGPQNGPANDWGDRVLQSGQVLAVAAGQRLVLEALPGSTEVQFRWEALPQAQEVAVAQASYELRDALRDTGSASLRVLRGLGRLAWAAGPGRRPAHYA